MKPLCEIFADGTVLDNTMHLVREGGFSAGNRTAIPLNDGNGVKSTYRAWSFLRDVETSLRGKIPQASGSGLVLFGPDADYEHNTEDDLLRYEEGLTHQAFSFSTGNLVGAVNGKFGDYDLRLSVSSRFGDEFLKFIIADADGFVEVPEQGGEGKGGYDWLLIYLWMIKLKKAFRLGLPKAYETRIESLTTVRGRLDPLDYALNSERGRYRCTYREHSYDNDATQLIARTLQHLDGHAFLRGTHSLNQTFQIATGGARHRLVDLLAAKPIKNPYFADYNEVMTLSKRIIRNELIDFGVRSETSAFFFDVSMLFEYFVRKLLKRSGVSLRDKTGATLSIPAGRRGDWSYKLIPDLVFDLDGQTYVFDVKYKSYDFLYGVKREDLFQLHTYVGQLSNDNSVAGCGFIYPIRESRWGAHGLDANGGILTHRFNQGGREIPFHVVFIKVPERGDKPEPTWPRTFCDEFKRSCECFSEQFINALRPRNGSFT